MLASSTPRSPRDIRGARENTIMIHLKHGSLSGKSITHMRFDFHVIHQGREAPSEVTPNKVAQQGCEPDRGP